MTKTLAFLALLFLIVPGPAAGSVPDGKFRPGKESVRHAEKLVKKMSTDEKIGQLVHIGINAKYLNQDSLEFGALRQQVVDLKIGGVVVFAGGIYQTVHLVNRLQSFSKLPLLISADFETGVGMRFKTAENFPWNMAIASTGNPEFAERLGRLTALESRALGIQQVFAPVIDINSNPKNPVINIRSFGEDPATVAKFGRAFVNGIQSGNVLATAKHFPGHGDTDVDSHRGLPVLDFGKERLNSIELLPFRELISGGVGSVMVSHVSLPQIDGESISPLQSAAVAIENQPVFTEATTIPATLSRPIVTGILREELGFDGLIVTDAMDMNGLTLYFEAGEAAVRAIEAGNDVLLKPQFAAETIEGIREAVSSGRLRIEQIDRAVTRQLAWKHKLGLFKNRLTDLEAIDRIVAGGEARDLNREIAENAITLVKGGQGLLPIDNSNKIGLLAVTNGKDFDIVGRAFLRSMRELGYKIEIVTIDERSGAEETESALEKLSAADVVIAGLFVAVRTGAKNSTAMPGAGSRIMERLLAAEKPVVVVSFGNPYLLNAFPATKTYIVAYGEVDSLQTATARALAGSIEFRGRLPISIGEIPAGTGLKIEISTKVTSNQP